jgi:formate hydrogenlyase subunit 3/multisubunit Na+/H+ antiporter MnhD subunit
VVGLGIKGAIVPLHTWLPDAHGRAPSSISAMLSGIVIQSAFYALIKVSLGLGLEARRLGALLIALAILNMSVGNGMALVQLDAKRLLAFSSVAQMGYMMLSFGIGLGFAIPEAVQAGFFFLVAHAAIKALAFMSVGVSHLTQHTTTIAELRGTAQRLPLIAVTMSVALGGLAAVPPLAGFAGKWFILANAIRSGEVLAYVGLAFLVVNSVIALGYYLPLIVTLFAPALEPEASPDPAGNKGAHNRTTLSRSPARDGVHSAEGDDKSTPPQDERGSQRTVVSAWMAAPLLFLGGLVVAIGLYAGPWLDMMRDAGRYLIAIGR